MAVVERRNAMGGAVRTATGVRLAAVGAGALALAGVAAACARFGAEPRSEPGEGAVAGTSACPLEAPAPSPLPRVAPDARTLAYWLARVPEPDVELLSTSAIRAHNAAFRAHDAAEPDADALAPFDLRAPVEARRLADEIESRLAFLRGKVERREYVALDGSQSAAEPFARRSGLPSLVSGSQSGELRVALELVPLRCGPTTVGLYKAGDVQAAFDRNLCSTVRPQEPLAVLAREAGGMWLVRTRGALGWIDARAKLSPAVPEALAPLIGSGDRLRVSNEVTLVGASRQARVGASTFLARAEGTRAHFATEDGFDVSQPLEGVETSRPLTRRAVLEEAFRFLDAPYGWGGHRGGRDCSEFLATVFGAFGLELPRNSAHQAQTGTFSVDLGEAQDPATRLALLDAAALRGVVLLSFPGHIMLYLGRSKEGVPMAMHAFAEYLESCGPSAPGETLRRVERVEVSDLRLGEGTSRRSFLERLTRLTVLGGAPGPALEGVVSRRPGAPVEARGGCRADESNAAVTLQVVPRHAHPGQPLRAIVASARDLGSAAMSFESEDGRITQPPMRRFGGPVFGYVAELPEPAVGKWTVRFADGLSSFACAEVNVHPRAPYREGGAESAWPVRQRWSDAHERLYSIFVEALFAYPFEDRSWKNLETLLRDAEHNLLFGSFGVGEEAKLELEPDCADLPYFLRSYFAWKLGLPFAYRHCNRGRKGSAPYCDAKTHSNVSEKPEGRDAVEKFETFARGPLANGVHSGSGRTAPDDSRTDHYPVPLTREALAPGAIFADPYGHGYVVVRWVPQGLSSHGMLLGVDAQPDGTIGLRRFWRGTFLFDPNTTEAGAGFKRFRPVVARRGEVVGLPNERIAVERPNLAPWSREQYEVSKDGFYDRVEALVNPRPLRAEDALEVLLQALHEQVKARVVSVENGEAHARERRAVIEMPSGHAVFETSGSWEDFSTPSRDMRLLLAIDTVTGFPAAARRTPARFGLPAGGPELDAAIAGLEARIATRLAALDVEYPRSDASRHRLTLADVVARARAFEVAYNPNDCAEHRWGAPEGSAELATCGRRAPKAQSARMETYRAWFSTRTRPTR